MRIRTIKPEFWRSEDIASLALADRLLFIGLWSYVDDNGVGRDDSRIIQADLFALEDPLSESSVSVQEGLDRLFSAGLIHRYSVSGKRFLHVTNWELHQKINRPTPGRYPLPTCDDAETHEPLTESSVSPQSILSAGTEEQRNRGTVNKHLSDAHASNEKEFTQFYSKYPKKEGKEAARRAFKAARKKASLGEIMDGLEKYLVAIEGRDRQFWKQPATWLNAGSWMDEYDTVQQSSSAYWRPVVRDG